MLEVVLALEGLDDSIETEPDDELLSLLGTFLQELNGCLLSKRR